MVDEAFSDSIHGWAYFSRGALRYNSTVSGAEYGEPFASGDLIGVYVDLVEGKISFSKNGVAFPVAYQNKDFLTLELYPACCSIKKDDVFESSKAYPED